MTAAIPVTLAKVTHQQINLEWKSRQAAKNDISITRSIKNLPIKKLPTILAKLEMVVRR